MKNSKILSVVVLFVIAAFFSCEEESTVDPNAKGELLLSFNKAETGLKSGVEPAVLLISLKSETGEVIFTNEEVELYKFNNEYISTTIPLLVGNYELTEFMVLDNNNNVLYATPKEGSNMAYLVNDPLGIEYTIKKDQVKKVAPEVISVGNISPDDFGYSTFSFNIVETFNFLTTVFVYNFSLQEFELADAEILVKSESDTLFDDNLYALTNLITLNANYDTYDIIVSKPGYQSYIETLTKESLLLHFSNPLTIILNETNCLILKLGPEKGKDAYVGSIVPDVNYGDHGNLHINAWTQGGILNIVRSYIDFDLSQLPQNCSIDSAFISLYYSDDPYYEEHSGDNNFVIERVTSDWDESTITWNNQPTSTSVNKTLIEGAINSTQDFPHLDITLLIQDIYSNMGSSFGLVLKMEDESAYRRLVFASSDNVNEKIWPLLEVYYTTDK